MKKSNKNLKIKPSILHTALFISSSALLLPPVVHAENDISYEASVNLIHQQPNTAKLESNTSLSADLVIIKPTQNGEWNLHLEASNTPITDGIANVIQDSNSDSGSSLDNRDEGRIQISEFNYRHNFTDRLNATLGLVDATSFLDSSEIMNDENHNFISPSLVNNPVIDFPDYVLGGAVEYATSQNTSARLFVSSTHGIADNNSRNYASLFEVNDDEKGLFSAIEFQYKKDNFFFNTGAWLHNGKHEALNDPQENDLSNYGGYLTSGYQFKQHQFETRFGVANPKVSSAKQFFSAAYQFNTDAWNLGIGYSSTQFSHSLITPQKAAETVETYLHIPINSHWHITPSLQLFKHPNYDSQTIQLDSTAMSANVRLNYTF
ncbi:hypothetical protein JCM30760_12710 [Thiomicrorhabdus hydrogeniphila]